MCTTPQSEQNQTTSQVWQLDPVRPALSSGVQSSSSPAPWALETDFAGYYCFRNLFTQDFLRANDATLLTKHVRLFRQGSLGLAGDGARYRPVSDLIITKPLFLTLSPSSRDVQPTPSLSPRSDSARSLWIIVPSVNGSMIVINAETRGILTTPHASAASGSSPSLLLLDVERGGAGDAPWQRFVLERVDHPSPHTAICHPIR